MASFATGVNFICCTGRIQPVGLNSNDCAMEYVRRHRSSAIELPCVPIEWLPTKCWRGAYCRSVYTQRRRRQARSFQREGRIPSGRAPCRENIDQGVALREGHPEERPYSVGDCGGGTAKHGLPCGGEPGAAAVEERGEEANGAKGRGTQCDARADR